MDPARPALPQFAIPTICTVIVDGVVLTSYAWLASEAHVLFVLPDRSDGLSALSVLRWSPSASDFSCGEVRRRIRHWKNFPKRAPSFLDFLRPQILYGAKLQADDCVFAPAHSERFAALRNAINRRALRPWEEPSPDVDSGAFTIRGRRGGHLAPRPNRAKGG